MIKECIHLCKSNLKLDYEQSTNRKAVINFSVLSFYKVDLLK
jgi:hypothetical protein